MQRRRYLALAGASMTALGLAGCSGGGGGTDAATDTEKLVETAEPTAMATTEPPTDETTMVETEAETEPETETETETMMEAEIRTATNPVTPATQGGFSEMFSGSGKSTVEELQLSPGPLTAEFSVSSEGYHSVTLIALESESYQDVLLIDGVISGDGSQVKTAAVGGGYNLNIEIEGDWELTIEQPADIQPESLPVDASGTGMSYVGPFQFDGPTTFNGSHSGDANFIVTGIPTDPSGTQVPIFNELENFEGETTARVSGTKYINVVADGEWTLASG